MVMKDGQPGDAEAPEQSVESWRTKLADQATKAVLSVAATATRQQVRLAVKTIRATPVAPVAAQAATIRKAAATPSVTDQHVIPSEKPGAGFRAAQAAKAADALRTTLDRETVACQRCRATLAAGTTYCHCGYGVQSPGWDSPVLSFGANPRSAPANDEHFERPADGLTDSPTAIHITADIPETD